MNRKYLKILIATGIILAVCVAYCFISSGVFSLDEEGISRIYEDVAFEKIVDGDTAYFMISGKSTKCRFLAIDTPEIDEDEPYAAQARDYSEKILKEAKTITLLGDAKADEYDKYDRLLVWVYADNELLQAKLVKEGLAEVKYVYDDYKYVDQLYGLQDEAKANSLGIWSLSE